MENHHFNGKIHYKWSFSIAVLVYQRVDPTESASSLPHPPLALRFAETYRRITGEAGLASMAHGEGFSLDAGYWVNVG